MDRRILRSPFKLGEIMDGVFRLYRKEFKKLFLFAMIFNVILLGWIKWLQFQVLEPGEIPIESFDWNWLLWVQWAVSGFLYFPLLQNLAFQMTDRQLFHSEDRQPVTWRQLFFMSFRNLGKVFIVHGLLIVLLLGLFFLFGSLIFSQADVETFQDRLMSTSATSFFLFSPLILYLYIRFSLLIPIISAENAGVLQAFKRSWWLTRGRFWAILGRLILLNLTILPFYLSSSMLLNVSINPVEQDQTWIIITFIIDLLLVPLCDWVMPFFFCLVYWDERMRKEGEEGDGFRRSEKAAK
jgi:membrane-anchored glycerophosphoryl diester phosphodiesterase (GDPDase)